MKPHGCIVPVSMIALLGLSLSCAGWAMGPSQFGTYTKEYQERKAAKAKAKAKAKEQPYVCTPRQAEVGECLPLITAPR